MRNHTHYNSSSVVRVESSLWRARSSLPNAIVARLVRWLSKIVGTKRIKAPNFQDIIYMPYEVVLRWEPTDLLYFTREINSRSLTTINEYSSKNVSEYN